MRETLFYSQVCQASAKSKTGEMRLNILKTKVGSLRRGKTQSMALKITWKTPKSSSTSKIFKVGL
jgi:hypothetical protein